MKFLFAILMTVFLVSCASDNGDGGGDEPRPVYRCEQMTPENKVSGCKLGDWYNFDLLRCNSTEERCQKSSK